MKKFAIIVIGYDRADALKRALSSIGILKIPDNCDVDLIISIDNSGEKIANVRCVAEDFNWGYGKKRVVIHPQRLGLIKHFIWVGDQTEEYEDVLFIEDDLFVSPDAVTFAMKAADFYRDDTAIAGISLYNPMICEFNKTRYDKIVDGYDVFFLQHPYWGNLWSRGKWDDFKLWLQSYEFNSEILPPYVAGWKSGSFKRIYIQYLIEKDKYIVIPHFSLCTNFADAGLHSKIQQYQYQNPIQIKTCGFRFPKFGESLSVYDAFMEIHANVLKKYDKFLQNIDFEVDLKQNKKKYHHKYVLTTRPVKKAIRSYSIQMKPLELNVIFEINGKGIALAKAEDILFDKNSIILEDIDRNYPTSIKMALNLLCWTIKRRFGK